MAQRGLAVDRELREVVEAKLEQRWSPEQSGDRLRPHALGVDSAVDEVEVVVKLVPSSAISQRPVIVFPSSLKVAVKRWENGS